MRQRPLVVTIFGILNVGFGLFSIVILAVTLALPKLAAGGNTLMPGMTENAQSAAFTRISAPIDGIAAVTLVVAGVGLLLMQNWARILSVVNGVYTIVMSLIGCLLALIGAGAMMVKLLTVIGCLITLVYPVLLIVFMLRPNVIASLKPPGSVT